MFNQGNDTPTKTNQDVVTNPTVAMAQKGVDNEQTKREVNQVPEEVKKGHGLNPAEETVKGTKEIEGIQVPKY